MSRYLTLSGPSGISGADLKRRIGGIMAGHSLRRLSRAKKALLGACGIAALVVPLALGIAAAPLSVLAQAPASARGAVGAAFATPPQTKVVTPPPAPTVKAGSGGLAPASPALAEAIAAGDFCAAVRTGATAPDIFRMVRTIAPPQSQYASVDPALAIFVRAPNGALGIGFADGNAYGFYSNGFCGFSPPGGLASLPTLEEAFGPPPPPPPPTPTPATIAASQLILSGSPAREAAAVLLAARPPGGPALKGGGTLDASAARYVQGRNGMVAVAIPSTTGLNYQVLQIPGSETYSGVASLPTADQVFPQTPTGAP